MKLIYIPLDERPCNYQYPFDIAKTNEDIEITRPSLEILGLKKQAADVSQIQKFLEQTITPDSTIICSIDMLVYGGLIPSRLHQSSYEQLLLNLDFIADLKAKYPELKIYAFSSIMRTPSYSSSDEEPDYYEQYGEQIYRRKSLIDQLERNGENQQLRAELNSIEIPSEIIADYEQRRAINKRINIEVLQLLANDVFEHLVIFQDDSAPYGYTAIDQKEVKDMISSLELQLKVDIYPGADEVGCSLLARAYNQSEDIRNKIYVEYSSTEGPRLIPLYEDRPMAETLKSHINVTNSVMTSDINSADLILMINSPGEKMQESWDQFDKRDRTYDSHRNLKAFVIQVKEYIDLGYKVAIADCAYANGCDLELIKLLDELQLIDKLYGFTGWNTHANTLGTVLSSMQVAQEVNKKVIENTIMHIFEAGFYQAKIRMDITRNNLETMDLNYFDLKQRQADVIALEKKAMDKMYSQMKLASEYQISDFEIRHPWNRMFEIEMKIKI